MRKHVVTGGPGTGKTTLVKALKKYGFSIVPEIPREIIKEEQKKGKNGYKGVLPWNQLEKFQKILIPRQIKAEEKISQKAQKDIFLDRSLADVLAYAEVGSVKVRKDIYDLIEQANYSMVFILESLPKYVKDKQRKEDLGFSKKLHDKLLEVYDSLGFDIVFIPPVSVKDRVKLVLQKIKHEEDVEIEKKYHIKHDIVRKKLIKYKLKHLRVDYEENTPFELKKKGYLFRIRTVGKNNILTVKGPNVGNNVGKKEEYSVNIPEGAASILRKTLTPKNSYKKRREIFYPIGDRRCTICLDYIPKLGEFVEIEAASENQVLLWEKRLGIAEYVVDKSYPELIAEKRGKEK